MIMRGKKDTKLSDYPLRLLRVQVYKESGELLFKRPLWLTAAGERRMELSLLFYCMVSNSKLSFCSIECVCMNVQPDFRRQISDC